MYFTKNNIKTCLKDDIDIIKIINAIESGSRNVYIVNEDGKYLGVAINSKIMKKIFEENKIKVTMIPAINGFNINEFDEKIKNRLNNIMIENGGLDELPLLRNGKIYGVIRRNLKKTNYDWNRMIPHKLRTICLNYKKIFLSSLGNDRLRKFYDFWHKIIKVELLSMENYIEIFDEKCLLICDENMFPDNMAGTVDEFYEAIKQYLIESDKELVQLNRKWKTFKENDYNELEALRCFDENEEIIVIENSSGIYRKYITPEEFRKNMIEFTGCGLSDYVKFNKDENIVKINFLNYIFGTDRKTIPVIDNDKVVAIANLSPISKFRKKEFFNKFSIDWNIISEKTAFKFMAKGSKVLISSDGGVMKGFCDRFSTLWNVIKIDLSIIKKYSNESYDCFLYNADLWTGWSKKYYIYEVYSQLLAMEIRKYLVDNDVCFYYLGVSTKNKIINYDKRKYPQPTYTPGGVIPVCDGEYYIMEDAQCGDMFNVIDGCRKTYYHKDDNNRSIFFYGPCTALGNRADDKHTIESWMQQYINNHNLKYNIFNYGTIFISDTRDINHLKLISKTKYKRGDIVVILGEFLWNKLNLDNSEYHDISDIFNEEKNREICCFDADGLPTHFDSNGYRAVAEYIYNDMEKLGFFKKNIDECKTIKSFDEYKNNFYKMDETQRYLKDYIDNIKNVYNISSKNVGAIVMNCNPFTKGHEFLIKIAREKVDYLYVFIVEEDSSEYSFNDRFEIAKANCDKYENVIVLPSGKYMISRITFAEYFCKDALQDIKVIPAMDVRIFGEFIAPNLNISKRFVGEEPIDEITKQYNETMKRILPEYGIEVIEVPRFTTSENGIISASKFRKAFNAGEYGKAFSMVPDETVHYFIKDYLKKGDLCYEHENEGF